MLLTLVPDLGISWQKMSLPAHIVLVVVAAATAFGLFVFAPRMRERRRLKCASELGQRRERVVSQQREQADGRARRAEEAEQPAGIAEDAFQASRPNRSRHLTTVAGETPTPATNT